MEFNLSPPVESSKFFECVIAQKYCPSSAMDMYSINPEKMLYFHITFNS